MKDKRNIKTQRVKNLLLQGKELSVSYLDKTLNVNNSPEIIRRLRSEMDILTIWKKSKSGTRYGVYRMVSKPKVDRIKERIYMDQAYAKI